MCLLIAGPSNQIRAALLNTEGLLADIFKHNADGLGAMYTTSKHKLRTPKVLPNTLAECIAFIRQLPDDERNLALHWRMRTHGDTNLENCHPYPVIDGKIALMHNGILSQGNRRDTTKSDTWHYIKDVVRPMLEEAPKMFKNRAWLDLVEYDISSGNRFAIMDHEGDMVILNKHTGVNHGDLWFSNTYAWDPALLIPGYAKTTKRSKYSNLMQWERDDDDAYDNWYGKGSYAGSIKSLPAPAGKTVADETIVAGPLDVAEDDVWNAIKMCDVDDMCGLLLETPLLVLHMLMRDCEFVPATAESGPAEYSSSDEAIVKALVDQTYMPLVEMIRTSHTSAKNVAQVICWYGDWVGKAIENKPAVNNGAAAEIIDIVAKERPDLVQPSGETMTPSKVVALARREGSQKVMDATREAVEEQQGAGSFEDQINQLELEVQEKEGELDQLEYDEADDDEITNLRIEIETLYEKIDELSIAALREQPDYATA